MNAEWFLNDHDIPDLMQNWLLGHGVRDPQRAARDVRDLVKRAGPGSLNLVARLAIQLDSVLPRCPEPGMALSNLERYVAAGPDPAPTLEKLAETPKTTEILLQVFSTSQYLSDVLIREPALIDWLQSKAERRDRDDPAPEGCVRAFVADAARHASAVRKAFERIIASPG